MASHYTRGYTVHDLTLYLRQNMSPCRAPEYARMQSVFFLVFLSVKSMWSHNHGGSLVFADKSLFLF